MNDSSLANLDSVSANLSLSTSEEAVDSDKLEENTVNSGQDNSDNLMAAVPSSVIQQSSGVIHASSNQLQQQLQNMHDNTDQEPTVHVLQEDDQKKRRDMLARRPSYRKILNDLSSESPVKVENSFEEGTESLSSSDGEDNAVPSSTNSASPPLQMQVSTPSSEVPLPGLQAIQISGANTQNHPATVVQFTNGQAETQYILTTQGPGNKLQAYTIRGQLPQSVVINSPPTMTQSPQQLAEEAARKREMRLLKNREAAKECRRKKKEYVKCLENRVAVLENQNKALIEELKSLKDLYCNKGE